MTRRLLPLISKIRNPLALLPVALRPLARLSLGRKLLLFALLTLAVAGLVWWWTGSWPAVALTAALGAAILVALLAIDLLARRLSRTHARAWEIEESKSVSIGEQRESWVAQVSQLRKMGIDPSCIPIHLLIGESGGGKTSSLKGAELNYSFGRDPVVGDGGTRNCLLYFTNDAWVIDTAGRYVISGEVGQDREVDEAEWLAFLGRLRRFRPRAPINGVVIAIPATALLDDSPEVARRKAMLLRKALNELRVQLETTFAVSVMITKADRIGGFAEYFEGVQDWRERRQLLGWSPPKDEGVFDAGSSRAAFNAMLSTFRRRRLEVVEAAGLVATADTLRRIHSFPEEFAGIADGLETYLTTMLSADRYFGALHFRGFFLTSSLQEGAPAFKACEELLGRPVEDFGFSGKRERSLFIHDFYAAKVFPESGFVHPTSRRKRRVTLVNRIGLVAAAALLACGSAYAVLSHLQLRKDALPANTSDDARSIQGIIQAARDAVNSDGQPPNEMGRVVKGVKSVKTLGDAIAGIKEGTRLTLGGFDLLSIATRDELISELELLYGEQVITLTLGGLSEKLKSAAVDRSALCGAEMRKKFFHAVELIVAARNGNVNWEPGSSGSPADQYSYVRDAWTVARFGQADGNDSSDLPGELASEYERAVKWLRVSNKGEKLKTYMQAAVGEEAVGELTEITDWHPTGIDCTFGDEYTQAVSQVYRSALAVEKAWEALGTGSWSDKIPEGNDPAAFYEQLDALDSYAKGLDADANEHLKKLTKQITAENTFFEDTLQKATGQGQNTRNNEVTKLSNNFKSSAMTVYAGVFGAGNGVESGDDAGEWKKTFSKWVRLPQRSDGNQQGDDSDSKARLSDSARNRKKALQALEELRRQEGLLKSEQVSCPEDDSYGICAIFKSSKEEGAARFEEGALSDIYGTLGTLDGYLDDRYTDADGGKLASVALEYRKRIFKKLVPRLGAAANAALGDPHKATKESWCYKNNEGHKWQIMPPTARIEKFATPLKNWVLATKSKLEIEGDDLYEVLAETDGYVIDMVIGELESRAKEGGVGFDRYVANEDSDVYCNVGPSLFTTLNDHLQCSLNTTLPYKEMLNNKINDRAGKFVEIAELAFSVPGGEDCLAQWKARDLVGRIRAVAIPLAIKVNAWQEQGIFTTESKGKCASQLETSIAKMVDDFRKGATTCVTNCFESADKPLEQRPWTKAPADTKHALRSCVDDYNAFVKSVRGLAEDCRKAGLSKVADTVKTKLVPIAPIEIDAYIDEYIDALVDLSSDVYGAGSREPTDAAVPAEWITKWGDEGRVFEYLRPADEGPSVVGPRSLVEDEIRTIAKKIEDGLRKQFAQHVRDVFVNLGDPPACLCEDKAEGSGTGDKTIDQWFGEFAKLEDRYKGHLPSQGDWEDAWKGHIPVPQVDKEFQGWLQRARAWRVFLYGEPNSSVSNGDELAAFTQRDATLVVYPSDNSDVTWHEDYAHAYLNATVRWSTKSGKGENISFNSGNRTCEISDALNVTKLVWEWAQKPGPAGESGRDKAITGQLALFKFCVPSEADSQGAVKQLVFKIPDPTGQNSVPVTLTFEDQSPPSELLSRVPEAQAQGVTTAGAAP